MKLNLGCGAQVVEGWVNVDYALGARLFKVPAFRAINRRLGLFNMHWDRRIFLHDLKKTFPWADASVEIVYSSHTLEHFSKEDGRRFLEECYRVLMPTGIIRIVVPDLKHEVDEYIHGRLHAEDFLSHLGVLYGNSDNRLKDALAPFYQFPHKCMYDDQRLTSILEEIGFTATAKSAFESDIRDIRGIELEDRTRNAVIVEGRKA